MRSRVFIPGLAIALLAVVGCGSSKTTSSSKSESTPASTTGSKSTKVTPVPSRTYTVKLTGPAEVPPGAPKGTGTAVIRILGKSNQVCWSFRKLSGVSPPLLYAHIHKGAAGTSGNIVVPLPGASYKASGCVSASGTLLKAIEANPHGYYVNIHSKQYPSGAVRAQL
jgi:hypothetical protein